MRQNIFKKLGEMFVEQIIEFELRGPGLPARACNFKTGYFHDKINILKENKSSNELLLTVKYIAEGDVPCFPSPGPSRLQDLSKNR